MTPEIAQVWLEHLRQQVLTSSDFNARDRHDLAAIEALNAAEDAGLVQGKHRQQLQKGLADAWRTTTFRLRKEAKQAEHPPLEEPWFSRVKAFSDQATPLTCNCDHVLQGTGVFYQSVGVIQCATCHHWQIIRKPVK